MRLQEKWLDYLYDELSLEEKLSFEQLLKEDSDLKEDLQAWQHLLKLTDQSLPQLKVPKALTQKVLNQIGLHHSWSYRLKEFLSPLWKGVWVKPAMGAAVALLVVWLVQGNRSLWDTPQVAQSPTEQAGASFASARRNLQYNNQDLFIQDAFNRRKPQFPAMGLFPSFKSRQNQLPRVSLASLGSSSSNFSTSSNLGTSPLVEDKLGQEVELLDVIAEQQIARWKHQNALTLRSVGDCIGAAEQLGDLIQQHPFYPLKIHAMAQRLDCLYQSGEEDKALEELKVLRELSPSLSLVLERRWNS
ncbi:MAG: hypothetical protein KDK66_09280 [Deltaproteobacteria bacterium]|nr:hypothetical protein [Deltaproteobacteria bacterium]